MSDLDFDGATVEFNGGASLLRAHGVPTLKFWVMEHPKTLVDRYVVVFDMPTDPVQEGVVPAICMNRLGHLFHDEVETGWLSQVIQNSVAPSDPNEYHAISMDELPAACKKAAYREMDSLLFGTNPDNYRALRKFTVVRSDHFFECLAENETHAAEQAIDARPDEEIQNVVLTDYAVL
jgi:hypothetical protein